VPVRLYEVVIRNLTSRHFKLAGPSMLNQRNVPEGRLLALDASLPPASSSSSSSAPAVLRTLGAALAPDDEQHPRPTAQAAFNASAKRGDCLEFNLAYHDGFGEGFTARAHAHLKSTIRGDAVPVGQLLDVSSTLEEVPRLVVEPPVGYAETALGVYSSPSRCEADRVGSLTPGDEVLAGYGPRRGRWLRISWPMLGWVQAETRDGRPLLVSPALSSEHGRPHLRQVVVVRPRHGAPVAAPAQGPAASLAEAAAVAAPSTWRPPEEDPNVELNRFAEGAASRARAAEAERFLRESSTLERTAFVSRHRSAMRGVF